MKEVSSIEQYPTYKPEGFSETIFKERYAFVQDETWEEACLRVSRQNVVAEKPEKVKQYEQKFYDVLVRNLFVPGGRIWYNSGRNNPQLLNCFLLNDQLDSKEGWGNIAKEMIVTSMTGGGCGIDFSDVRPNGAEISSQKGACPGPVELMELVNNCGHPVRAGGARRVALMFSLDLDHPDVDRFLDYKLTKGKLELANVSVRAKNTSAFIKAVKNDEQWPLSWKGQYKSEISARYLWDKIISNAYNSAEPGFLNWELTEKESSVSYITDLASVNPCGEVAMSPYDACCLGHIVLYRFIKEDGSVDLPGFAEAIRLAVRFLDNTITVNHFPLQEMKDTTSKFRRIGLGFTGLADALILAGYKYGSSEANKFVDGLLRFMSKQAYEASVMLAIEKGPFPACVPEKHVETGFVKRMPHKIKSLIAEHGIRNCAILTVAPTGTVSILSGNCSSGLEPIFSAAYERRFWKEDQRQTELVMHPLFTKFVSENRSTDNFISSRELSVREHMEFQKVVQKHIDNSISKTINIPEDYPMSDVAEVWLEYLPYLKGTTFYRENTRGYVDKDGKVHEPPLKALSVKEALERMKEEKFTMGSEEDSCKSGVCEI